MKADLTLRARQIVVRGHEAVLEGALLDEISEQIPISDIIELYGVAELLDEIGEAAARQYFIWEE